MKKINVAELLKDCPKGMELDCYLFDGLEFDHIDTDNENYPIVCRAKNSEGEYYTHTFTKYGWYTSHYDYAKCVIFPKGKTTWEGFQRPYINGDIVYTIGGSIAILGDKIGEYSVGFYSHCGLFYNEFDFDVVVSPERLATEEEKEKLFKVIKDNGYRWNEETKTLEKLQCKFDINTLKPFDKVLVKTDVYDPIWSIDFFGMYSSKFSNFTPFMVTGGSFFQQCIPYEGNEHLLGTTDDCEEFYKTWK